MGSHRGYHQVHSLWCPGQMGDDQRRAYPRGPLENGHESSHCGGAHKPGVCGRRLGVPSRRPLDKTHLCDSILYWGRDVFEAMTQGRWVPSKLNLDMFKRYVRFAGDWADQAEYWVAEQRQRNDPPKWPGEWPYPCDIISSTAKPYERV